MTSGLTEPLIDLLPALAPYRASLVILSMLVTVALVQSFLCGPLAFARGAQSPGAPLKGDHVDFSFRVMRTYANSVENLPAFGLALFVAILAGVSPPVVTGLAAAHLAFRLTFWAVYYHGGGKDAGGRRTLSYVGGLVTNAALAGSALLALL